MKKSKRTRVGMSEHLRELAIRDNSIKSLRANMDDMRVESASDIIENMKSLRENTKLRSQVLTLSAELSRERGINDALIKLVNGD